MNSISTCFLLSVLGLFVVLCSGVCKAVYVCRRRIVALDGISHPSSRRSLSTFFVE